MGYLLLNDQVAKESRDTMTAYKAALYKIHWNFYQIFLFAAVVNFSLVNTACP